MKFLTRTECEAFAKRLGAIDGVLNRRNVGIMKKRIDFLYESRLGTAGAVSAEIASYCGSFSCALLWTHSLIWGDRTEERGASKDWHSYGLWRRKQGADAGLYELPGQLCEAGEQDKLAKAIEWTIYTGSDAIIISRPTMILVHLSHDDLISFHCRSTPINLENLERLGLRRVRLP